MSPQRLQMRQKICQLTKVQIGGQVFGSRTVSESNVLKRWTWPIHVAYRLIRWSRLCALADDNVNRILAYLSDGDDHYHNGGGHSILIGGAGDQLKQ